MIFCFFLHCERSLLTNQSFEAKVALVTGAGAGIGLATVKAFAEMILFPLDCDRNVSCDNLLIRNRGQDMAYKYLVTLTEGDDGYIVAECPALPGCVSQGKTRDEALKNIQEAIEGIIKVRKAQKLPIPSPDIVEISVAA